MNSYIFNFKISFKTWNIVIISSILLVILSLVTANILIDPFNIFKTNIFKDYQVNQRFVKAEYLNKNNKKYNAYMMGSSRIGTTSPWVVEQYLPGHHFYNMTVGGCTQYDTLLFIKYFIENKFLVNTIYLQIDITDIYGYQPLIDNYYAKHHPSVVGGKLVPTYAEYLSTLPWKNLIGKVKNHFKNPPPIKQIRYDNQNTGRWYMDQSDLLIEHSPELYIQQEKSFFDVNVTRGPDGKFIKENIEAIKQIKELADAHNIKLIVIIPPYHHLMMSSFPIKSYIEYLNAIGEITPFWDFSGYNSITFDNHYYYSKTHYREILGKLMAAKIFNDKNISIPNDFGIWVDKENLHAHLTQRKQELIAHDQMNEGNG